MYIRFVVNTKDEDSGRRVGLFHAARELREMHLVSEHEERQLLAIKDWFNEHLEKPDSFSNSKKSNAKNVAISWFKDTATQHISKMYEMAKILEAHDVSVEVLKTPRPGYIVYEDKHQVTAEPYADTKT